MIREWSKSGTLCGLLRCELFSGMDFKVVSLARKRTVKLYYFDHNKNKNPGCLSVTLSLSVDKT